MKKLTKVCLIVVVILAMIGIAACAAGAVLGAGVGTIRELWNSGELEYLGWRIGSNGIGWTEEEEGSWKNAASSKERFKSSEVRQIQIELKHGSLELEELDDEEVQDEIIVEMKKNDGNFKVELENGVLTLKDERKNARKDYQITLKLPKGIQLEKLNIENRAGVVESDELALQADKIQLEVDAGELILEDIRAKEFNLKVGAGNAEIDGLDAENTGVSCGVGNIDLEMRGRETDYNYQIKCGVGSIYVNREGYTALGKDHKIDNNASKDIDLDCGVGNITLETEEY